jgi:C4-dicarboxylate-specific signal transduction histidine kinase
MNAVECGHPGGAGSGPRRADKGWRCRQNEAHHRSASCTGDRVQLQQVVLNLIMNAIAAMSTISDRPRTLLIKSAIDTERVLIQVQNSGKGLDPEHSDRRFESFFATSPRVLE